MKNLTEKEVEKYFECLGVDEKHYYFANYTEGFAHCFSEKELAYETSLMRLADEAVWQKDFPKTKKLDNGEEKIIGTEWRMATSWMMAKFKASVHGMFDVSKIAGLGAWWHGEKVVIHLGKRLFVDGSFVGLDHFKNDKDKKLVFTRRNEMEIPENITPLSIEERKPILALMNCYNWKSPEQVLFVAGWTVMSLICGALDWRPHMWITANPNSGKSTLLECIEKILQCSCKMFESASTTEAGIRISLHSDAKPVIIDEMEATKEEDIPKVQRLIDLIRSSSSANTAVLAKGTAGQKAVNYKIRSMFLLASVNNTLKNPQDIQRFTLVGLDPVPKGAAGVETKRRVLEIKKLFTAEFSIRLLFTLISKIDSVFKTIDAFNDVLSLRMHHRSDQRSARHDAILLAGYWFLISDKIPTHTEVLNLIKNFEFFKPKPEYVENVEEAAGNDENHPGNMLLDHLLKSVVRIAISGGAMEMTIREALAHSIQKMSKNLEGNDKKVACEEALKRYGLRYIEGHLAIANKNQNLQKLLINSGGSLNWNQVFERIEGAAMAKARFLGNAEGCCKIPLVLHLDDEDGFIIETPSEVKEREQPTTVESLEKTLQLEMPVTSVDEDWLEF